MKFSSGSQEEGWVTDQGQVLQCWEHAQNALKGHMRVIFVQREA